MRYSLAASALVLAATTVLAQDPAGQTCVANSQGTFEVMIEEINGPTVARRGLKTDNSVKHLGRVAKRQEAACMSQGTLVATLRDGVLTDSQGRTGNIVANNQFQFDPNGGQPDALFTEGFSICEPSNHLALNGKTVFYQCQSGNFYNLYDQAIAEQCQPVYITVIPCDGSTLGMGGMASGMSTSTQQIEDGQIQNGLNQIEDGQLQVPGSVNQIADGQLQNGGAGSGNVNQIADGQLQNGGAGNGNVNQIADGQLQNGGAGNGNVNQIADGQLQNGGAGNGNVNQIADGQLQNGGAGNGGNVNQIADGQLQNGGAVNQIADGQIQGTDSSVAQIEARQVQGEAPTPTQAPDVAQFADGQLQPRQVTDEAAVTSYTDAAMFTNAAVPIKAKRAFVGVAAAAAGYAAMI